MKFGKYHGAGNDFVVVDLRTASAADREAAQDPEVVRALLDRQFGIGGDGVLAILPAQDASATARMRVLNADGSEAEMCGNGIRCVVKQLVEANPASARIALNTGAGQLVCEAEVVGGAVQSVTVDMGRPRLTRSEIPMDAAAGDPSGRCIDQVIEIAGHAPRRFTAVSMGNPHAVTFVGSRAEARQLSETVGPLVENHPWFPRRTNAEFVHVRSPRELDVGVWERGCGITLACGTGACASVVAAVLNGHCEIGTEVAVHLIGGTLAITVLPDLATVLMRGPALHVFDGEVDLRAVVARPVG